jgi:hypothetical protein
MQIAPGTWTGGLLFVSQHHPSKEEDERRRPVPHQNLDLLVRGDGESSRTWFRRHPLWVGASVAEMHGEGEESTRRGSEVRIWKMENAVSRSVPWFTGVVFLAITPSLFRGAKSYVGLPTLKKRRNSR